MKDNYTVYFVSDNTGDTNGGSDKLVEKYKRGHVIYNTRNGDQACECSTFRVTTSVGSYLRGEGLMRYLLHKSQAHELKARQGVSVRYFSPVLSSGKTGRKLYSFDSCWHEGA